MALFKFGPSTGRFRLFVLSAAGAIFLFALILLIIFLPKDPSSTGPGLRLFEVAAVAAADISCIALFVQLWQLAKSKWDESIIATDGWMAL